MRMITCARAVTTVMGITSVLVLCGTLLTPTGRSADGTTIRFSPGVGGVREPFVATFTAPLRTYGPAGSECCTSAYYYITVRGGKRCRRYAATTSYGVLRPGDRVVLVLRPDDRMPGDEPFETYPTRWCAGDYRGTISHWDDETNQNRVIGTVRFKVRQRRPRGPFSFHPKVANPRESFVARFTAPYQALYGGRGLEGNAYRFSAVRRGSCRRVLAVTRGYRAGDRVVLVVAPHDQFYWRRNTWCRGRYVGRVDFVRTNRRGAIVLRRRIRSNIVFRVLEPRAYLGAAAVAPATAE